MKVLKVLLFFFISYVVLTPVTPVAASLPDSWGDADLYRFNILNITTDGLDLVLDGNYAYLAGGYSGLYILDISDPSHITVKSHLPLSAFGLTAISLSSIATDGSYIYCGFRKTSGYREQGYIKVVNIVNLETSGPTIEANDLFLDFTLGTSGRVTGLFIDTENQRLYAALRLGGLGLIDISDPSDITIIGKYNPPETVEYQEAIIDDAHKRAYVGAWFQGILAIDISDPVPANWTKVKVDDSNIDTRYWYLAQRGQYLYAPVADSPTDNTFDEGLAIFDLSQNFSDPGVAPVRIAYAAIPPEFQCESALGGKDEGLDGGDPGPHQITLTGNYAVVANGCMGLAIFDISDPYNPFFIREYEIPGQTDFPWSIAIRDDYLITVGENKTYYVANDVYAFKINPAADEPTVPTKPASNNVTTSPGCTISTSPTKDPILFLLVMFSLFCIIRKRRSQQYLGR